MAGHPVSYLEKVVWPEVFRRRRNGDSISQASSSLPASSRLSLQCSGQDSRHL